MWTVTNITDDTEIRSQGVVKGKVVHYRVLNNVDGTLFIPDMEFNAQKVQELVHRVAVEIVNALALEGPDIGGPTPPVYTFNPPEQ